MQKKQQRYVIRGMNRDLSISKGNTEFSYHNQNIRIDVNEDANLLHITNEKSTKEIASISGSILGYCIIEDKAVIFTKEEDRDKILLFHNEVLSTLVSGCLNFKETNLIETIPLIETSSVKKVYWIDGRNVPRVINIEGFTPIIRDSDSCIYDFDITANLSFKDSLSVDKNFITQGSFPSGVIQYVYTYFNTFGKESPIVNYSLLNYLTHDDRGGSPEDKIIHSFDITIDNIEDGWDKIRVYSIIRTSLDSVPLVSIVKDIEIGSNKSITITDTNTGVIPIDPTILFYIGSDSIIPYTFTSKDNALFLGNYKLDRETVIDDPKSEVEVKVKDKVSKGNKVVVNFDRVESRQFNEYQLNKDESFSRHLKSGEYYHLGVVLQHKNGKLSDVVYLKGYTMPNMPLNIKDGTYIPKMLSVILPDEIKAYKDKGYVRAIPIIGFNSSKRVICQGVLNPSVFNVGDRATNSPYAQSSWFFRPQATVNVTYGIGRIAYCHNEPIHTAGTLSGEIINHINDGNYPDFTNEFSWKTERNKYIVDRTINSLYSPEALLDSKIHIPKGCSLNIIGAVPIHNANREYDIVTSKGPYTTKDSMRGGNIEFTPFKNQLVKDPEAFLTLAGIPKWREYYKEGDNEKSAVFTIYPFHNQGGIGSNKGGDNATSILKKKVLLNYRYSKQNAYYDIQSLNIEDAEHINFIEDKLYKLGNDSSGVFYKNYSNKILYGGGNQNNNFENSYPLSVATELTKDDWTPTLFSSEYKYSEPVPITYKNNKHIAIKTTLPTYYYQWFEEKYSGLNSFESYSKSYEEYILESFSVLENISKEIVVTGRHSLGTKFIYKIEVSLKGTNEDTLRAIDTELRSTLPISRYNVHYEYPTEGSTNNAKLVLVGHNIKYGVLDYRDSKNFNQEVIAEKVLNKYLTKVNSNNNGYVNPYKDRYIHSEYGYLLLGEIVNNNVVIDSKENIKWSLAGYPSFLDQEIEYIVGDTYYQRFNCFATFPREEGDVNQIIDALSFMVETRVNLNSAYDRNIYKYQGFHFTEENTNKMNPVYRQDNNFFKYVNLNSTLFNNVSFPSTITFSKSKYLGEEIDTWQHLTGVSKLDLEGVYGKITKLITQNDNILSFQDNSIAAILYNSRVQIPVSDGVPIEISNGNKMEGYRYISNTIGCQNKWSVCKHRNGVMFIDDNSDILYNISEGLIPISETLGFRTYMQERLSKGIRDLDRNATLIQFDDYRNDLYLLNDKCLSYSNKLQQFESFFDYTNTEALFNISSNLYSIAKGRVWKHRQEGYNNLYGITYPFKISYKINPEGMNDKIFTNIETRADSFDSTNFIKDVVDLDTIEVKNEYQYGKSKLKYSKFTPSNLKKKFRTWRAEIPRQEKTMNRIRNTWCYLTLTSKLTNDKTDIHDLTITYYE